LTQVLDRPLTGRILFEEVIRENLDVGRPDQRAFTTIPHHPLCGGGRGGKPLALAAHPAFAPDAENVEPEKRVRKSGYRPWAELLQRTFSVDVRTCPSCQGRMRLLAVVKNPAGIARYLAATGELTEVPSRAPGRGPPYWKSQVLRRLAVRDDGHGSDHSSKGDEAASAAAAKSAGLHLGGGASPTAGFGPSATPRGAVRRARLLMECAGRMPTAAPRSPE
jgi:hypothetical protein